MGLGQGSHYDPARTRSAAHPTADEHGASRTPPLRPPAKSETARNADDSTGQPTRPDPLPDTSRSSGAPPDAKPQTARRPRSPAPLPRLPAQPGTAALSWSTPPALGEVSPRS